MREVKVFDELDRRDIANNLYCYYCGNTNQWQMNLKTRYIIECQDSSIEFKADPVRTKRVFDAVIRNIERMLYNSHSKNRPTFQCANCGNGELDTFAGMQELCWNVGCPGCFHCNEYIDEEELRDLCTACIKRNDGKVDEEFCFNLCEHFDYGLSQVMDHYAITLEELKRDAGY